MMNDFYDIDYSADPTVDLCLNCKAKKCNGSCARIRAIEEGKPDPGEAYAGIDLRALNRNNGTDVTRSRRVRELAEKYGRDVSWINTLLRRGQTFEEIEQAFAEKEAKARILDELEAKGLPRRVVYAMLREGRTLDEIRKKVA